MRLLRTYILFLSAYVIVAGCAVVGSIRPEATPVTDPTQRLEFPGLSVLPPKGENWFVAPPPPSEPDMSYIVVFRKKLTDRPPRTPAEVHTIAATVIVADLKDLKFESPPAFLQFFEREGEKVLGRMTSPRHRVLASKVSLDFSLGSTCVKYGQTVEDTEVPEFPGAAFVLQMQGLRCLHPHWPRYWIDVGYSQRYFPGQQPLSIEAEVEPFQKSLVFTPTRPIPPLRVTTIPVGGSMAQVAVSGDFVFVAQNIPRESAVVAIDPRTNRPVKMVRLEKALGDLTGLAIAEGAVWVSHGHGVWTTPKGGTLSRIDPVTGQVVATIAVGRAADGVAVGEGAVWVANSMDDTVLRIDPKTNEVVSRSGWEEASRDRRRRGRGVGYQ